MSQKFIESSPESRQDFLNRLSQDSLPCSGKDFSDTAEAKACCATCAVKDTCLEFAVVFGEEYRIWGGLNPREREPYTGQVDDATIDNWFQNFYANMPQVALSSDTEANLSAPEVDVYGRAYDRLYNKGLPRRLLFVETDEF